MYQRVVVPMEIAVLTVMGVTLLGVASTTSQRIALDRVSAGEPGHWMLPVLPTAGWLVLLGVFFAVRLCSLRGGSRGECIAVGLSPLVLALISYLAMVAPAGLSAILSLLGSTAPISEGRVTLGTAVMVRATTAQLLGLAGACLGATWLWFFVAKRGAAAEETGSAV
jgi:hypothetical protein